MNRGTNQRTETVLKRLRAIHKTHENKQTSKKTGKNTCKNEVRAIDGNTNR